MRKQKREETLYQFLMRKYLGEDSPEGDLAADTKRLVLLGKLSPQKIAKTKEWQGMSFLRFMIEHGACREAILTAIKVILEYRHPRKNLLHKGAPKGEGAA